MSDPTCCGVEMWLHALEEILDRGGAVHPSIEDALAWECLDCDRIVLVAMV